MEMSFIAHTRYCLEQVLFAHLYFCIFMHSKSLNESERCELFCAFNTAKENLALLLLRVQDSKTNVRKSALQVVLPVKFVWYPNNDSVISVSTCMTFNLYSLQALVGLLKHDVISMSLENLAVLSERCRDPAVSVKKKALQCLGQLLAVSLHQQLWERKHSKKL